jgi:hypothetical protein
MCYHFNDVIKNSGGFMQKRAIAVLVISTVVLAVGIMFTVISCDGSCGASNHGGDLTWVCPKFYSPPALNIPLIVFGGLGLALTLIFSVIKSEKG